ncbi:13067_t:CDS:2 [Entrophospora sp. SA101]|nr:13067_t:CDS:2 [Entrophospora sp. SA101]
MFIEYLSKIIKKGNDNNDGVGEFNPTGEKNSSGSFMDSNDEYTIEVGLTSGAENSNMG